MRLLARRSLLRVSAASLASGALLAGMLANATGAAAAVGRPAAAAHPAAAGQPAAAAHAAAAAAAAHLAAPAAPAHLMAPAQAAAAARAAAALQPAATTVTSCQVNYAVQSDWGSGFVIAVTITNTGSAITSWTLGYSYSGNQKLSGGWSGTWSQSGSSISVANASWNGSLGSGASTQIGAQFTYSGSNAAPSTFTLNGTTCNGASPSPSPSPTTSPTSSPSPSTSPTASPSPSPTSTGGGGGTGSGAPMVSITSPTAGEIFTPGSAITLQASPVSGSGTITSVTFYQSTSAANDTEIGVATASPWAVQWANVPAGSYSITAVASNGSESLTSYPIAITVESPAVVINPNQLAVQQGNSATVGVALSAQPSSTVTVSVAGSGDPDLSVSSGASLTFTTSNWSVPQTVSVTAGTNSADAGAQGTVTASATGYTAGTTTVTEALAAGSQSKYDQWFLNLYSTIMNPANGYFSPKGIPYHSVETLIVEAPDYGHETTSETYSYYLWLTADYGRVTGNWTPFNNAWANMQTYMIPSASQQPGQSTYNASSPAEYGPDEAYPSNYPVALNSSVPVGSDPLAAELTSTYGTSNIYAPMWIMDTDNRYGFGQCEDGTSTPSFINSYQRGPMESVWDTIPQPDCDLLKYGGPNGFLDLFNNGGGSFSSQYKYTDAPDADARMIQAAYLADTYAKAQGKESAISATLADAAKLGDYLRYSMFDKYFKQITATCSQLGSVGCPAGTSKANEDTYLLSWYYAWGGASTGAWSWRISGEAIHQGYQDPVTAYALSTDTSLIPLSPTAKADWAASLTTQLNFFQWLQSSQGAIAGGVTNNWGGNYGDVSKPPSGDTTFDGLYYTPAPEYMNPPSNQWFGYQTWPMERLAEYYYDTGNTQAQAILAKWVSWAESVATFNTSTGTFCLPGTMTWSGQPGENYTSGIHPAAGQHQPQRLGDRLLGGRRRGRLAGQGL